MTDRLYPDSDVEKIRKIRTGVGRVKKLLNPLRTQVRAVRLGTPPDFEDGLVEVRNRRLGSVIISYHQLVALIHQAKDGRHLAELGNAEIRAAKKFRKLTRKDSS